MSTKSANTKEGIDNREIRACEGCMIVVPEGNASGRFDVYSANDGVNKTYSVDLRAEMCECPDHEHRGLECKHIKRVKLALGILPVPAGVELDEALVADREKYGVEPEPPATSKAVATDGGVATKTVTQDTGVDEPTITGPWTEPIEQGGANYWRCEDCGRESLHRGDLKRSEFHVGGCALR